MASQRASIDARSKSKPCEIDQETVDKLRKSKDIVGYLGDVIKDQEGTILSGRHRKVADPEWPEKEVKVSDPLDRELKILHYNIQRIVSREETQRRLLKIAKIIESKGVTPQKVCSEVIKVVPYSESYVRELLPDEYKMETKAREFAPPVAQTDAHTRMDATLGRIKQVGETLTKKPMEWVQCQREGCNIKTKMAPERIVKGKLLCSKCYREVTGEEPPRIFPAKIDLPTPAVLPKVTKRTTPDISWSEREARMHPKESKMEEAIFLKLIDKGLRVASDREFCVLSTKPDLYLPDHNLAIYLDGEEVHKNREERDTELRILLKKRHKTEVLSLTYTAYTDTQRNQIFTQIMEEITQ